MKISEYTAFLERTWRRGFSRHHHQRILTKGKPGIGKTYGARDAAARIGADFISLCAPLLSPVKVGGYPRPPAAEGDAATHCLFDGIHQAMNAKKDTILFWDDLGMATGETLKAIVELVQFGQIDGRRLPGCVVQAGATNDVGHGADVQGLIEPLKTRWHTIIEVETNLDDVVAHGLAQGWPADLCAFLRNEPNALHDWKPTKSITIEGSTPRGWEYCAQWINDGEDDPEVIAGCVGKGRATQYLAFRRLINELPDVDQVIMDPKGSPVPENPSARFLVATALAAKMNSANFGQCLTYLNRLPAMFRAFSIRDAFRAESARRADGKLPKGHSNIANSRDFTAWVVSGDGQAVMAAGGVTK